MSKPLQKTLRTLLKGYAAIPEHVPKTEISGIANDSRQVEPGDLFIAFKGVSGDGRDYMQQAIDAGAAAIVFDEYTEPKTLTADIPLLPAKYLSEKQGEIAARFYDNPSEHMTVIGITGTNGKTTCAQFIAQALTLCGRKTAMMGTLGYGIFPNIQSSTHTTVDAVTLQKRLYALRQQGAEAVAMEVSSHGLVQYRVNGVDFDIAVFTQLSRDHLDYHGTMQAYASAKLRLFQMPELQCAVVNIDDELGARIQFEYSDFMPVIGVTLNTGKTEGDVVAAAVKTEQQGFVVDVTTPWGEANFSTQLLGRFNIRNLLTVIGVLGRLNIPLQDIIRILPKLQPVEGRMQRLTQQGCANVVIDYSHTPDALQQALTALRESCQGQLWCVFGCGGDRDQGKRSEMGKIAEAFSDHVIITNDNPRHESPQKIIDDICSGLTGKDAVTIQPDRAAAIRYAVQQAQPNDMILVAGKGHETYQIVGDTVSRFSDKETVLMNLMDGKKHDDDTQTSC